MNLFEVKTKKWKTYYTFANGYDEAAEKVLKKIIEEDEEGVLDKDGSLKDKFSIDEIAEIKDLGDQLVE